jgi:high-affinity Fe2+/Pb2+ permease
MMAARDEHARGQHGEQNDDDVRAIHGNARKRIIRRATLFSVGFLAAGLVIALAGAALVAWLFSRGSLPFFETWLVVTAIIVLPGLVAAAWKQIRDR